MILTLQSEDGVVMEVPEDVAFLSNILRNMAREPDSPSLREPIKMQNITAETLAKIIEWCTMHRGEVYKPKEEHEDPRITLTRDDEEWMDVDSDKLLNLLLAADFLDIPGIMDIVSQKICNMATGKTVEEIREIYGLVNDFTPEEEEEIRRRFSWVEA